MKKSTLFFFLIMFLCVNYAKAQQKTILFKNDSLTFIHDSYEKKTGNIYSFSSIFYVIDNFSNKIDTIGKPNGFPVGKFFYNGKYFSVIYQHLDRFSSIVYSLFTKINGKWKIITYYIGSLDQPKNAVYKLEQTDIFTLNESLSGYYPDDMVSELKIDVQKKVISRYKISREREREKTEDILFPDFNY